MDFELLKPLINFALSGLILGVTWLKRADLNKATIYISILVFISFISDSLSYYFADRIINTVIWDIYTLIEITFIFLFFKKTLIEHSRTVTICFSLLLILFTIEKTMSLEKAVDFTIVFEYALNILLVMLFYKTVLNNLQDISLMRSDVFWISFAILFNSAGQILLYCIRFNLSIFEKHNVLLLNIQHGLTLTYLFFITLGLCLHKKQVLTHH
jgi:hypothetical protein